MRCGLQDLRGYGEKYGCVCVCVLYSHFRSFGIVSGSSRSPAARDLKSICMGLRVTCGGGVRGSVRRL